MLLYALGGKHNDLVMMALVMARGLLLLTRPEVVGGAALVAAVGIKPSAGLLAPVLALGAPRGRRAVVGVAAATLVLAEVTCSPWEPTCPTSGSRTGSSTPSASPT